MPHGREGAFHFCRKLTLPRIWMAFMNRPGFRQSRQTPLPRNVYRPCTSVGRAMNPQSAARPEPHCAIKTRCGTCKYVNDPYEASLADKYQRGLEVLRRAGVATTARLLPPEPSPRAFEYRSL